MSTEAQETPGEDVVPETGNQELKWTFEEQTPEVVVPIEEIPATPEAVSEVTTEQVTPESEVPTPEAEEEYEVVELDENTAWEYIKGKKGITADNIDELLTPKEQKKYAPEMEKFNEFIEKTGNKNFNDFLETQKDWSTESADIRLKAYLKLSNPDLNDKQVDHLYNKRYNTDGLDEEDDEDEITDREINTTTDLRRADEFLQKRKEEFMADRGSDDHIPEEYREAKTNWEDLIQQQESIELARKTNNDDYLAKTEAYFSKDFDGIKVKLGNDEIGFEEISIKPENIQDVKSYQADISNFNKEFFDEKTGRLEKPKEWHEAIYMAKNYKAELNKAFNLGMAKKAELDDKLSKNIQPDNIRQSGEIQTAKWTFSVD